MLDDAYSYRRFPREVKNPNAPFPKSLQLRRCVSSGAFQRTIAAGAHSLPGTPGWAAQILSSQRGISIMTERGVPTYAPQRQAVTLEQAIVVATAGLHIPRNSCVQGCAYECVED